MAQFASNISNSFVNDESILAQWASNPSVTRGSSMHIDCHPTKNLIVYPCRKVIVVRDLDNPKASFVYRAHEGKTTVAKFSPSGNYIASADEFGRMIVWAWDNPQHITKFETRLFAAGCFDLDWSPDNSKILAAGDGGSGMMVKCIVADSGNSVGEMVGHNRRAVSCAFKQTRPFRAMSCGEDNKVAYFKGPPFKMEKTFDYSTFVNCVRISKDGTKAVSVGADKAIQFYDAAEGEATTTIKDAHAGTIYEAAFSPDGSKLLTGGADKVCKIWDVASGTCETTFTFDGLVGDQQNSVLWPRADLLLSVSLSGNINVLDPANPERPKSVLVGHQSQPGTLSLKDGVAVTGDGHGVLCKFNLGDDSISKIEGQDENSIERAAHTTQITGAAVMGDKVVSVAMDKSIAFSSLSDCRVLESLEMETWPVGLVACDATGIVAVLHKQSISFYKETNLVGTSPLTGVIEATCIAIKTDGSQLAVGTAANATHVYDVTNGDVVSIAEIKKIDARQPVSSLAYTPTGDMLAIGDKGHMIEVHTVGEWACKIKSKWCFHTSFVSCMEWSIDGAFLVSGGADDCIFVWDINNPMKRKQVRFAHGGGVTGVTWADNNTVLSCGQDGTLCQWNASRDK